MTQQVNPRKTLHLAVVDGAGKPVPGAVVTIDEASEIVPEIALLSNPEGEVTMRLPAGRYRFSVRGQGNCQASLVLHLNQELQSASVALPNINQTGKNSNHD